MHLVFLCRISVWGFLPWVALKFPGNKVLEIWVEQIPVSSTSDGVVVLVTNHKHSLLLNGSIQKWYGLYLLWIKQSLMPTSGCKDVSTSLQGPSAGNFLNCLSLGYLHVWLLWRKHHFFPQVHQILISVAYITHKGHEAHALFLLVLVGLLALLCSRYMWLLTHPFVPVMSTWFSPWLLHFLSLLMVPRV